MNILIVSLISDVVIPLQISI
jgi:hypothetical protein